MATTRRIYPIGETSERTSFSRSTIYRMMDDGELPFVRIRSRRFIRHEDIEKLIADRLEGGHANEDDDADDDDADDDDEDDEDDEDDDDAESSRCGGSRGMSCGHTKPEGKA